MILATVCVGGGEGGRKGQRRRRKKGETGKKEGVTILGAAKIHLRWQILQIYRKDETHTGASWKNNKMELEGGGGGGVEGREEEWRSNRRGVICLLLLSKGEFNL